MFKIGRKFRLGILSVLLISSIISCTTEEIIEKIGQMDTEKPVVAFIAPLDGAVFHSGDVVTLSVNATDNKAVDFVEYFIDGQGKELQALGMGPFNQFSWDTQGWSAGQYTLLAKATDTGDNFSHQSITVTLLESAGLTLVMPTSNEFGEVSGTIQITAQVGGDADKVIFYADGNQIGQLSAAPFALNFDTTALSDKTYSIQAKSYKEDILQATSPSYSLKIKNNTATPSVDFTAPVENAVISQSVLIKATASANAASVTFYLGETFIGNGVKNQNSYELSWDSRTVADGGYTLIAKVKSVDNQESTDSVAITVHNTVSSLEIKNTLPATLSQTVSIETEVSSDIQKVAFFVDSVSIGEITAAPFTLSWNTRSISNGSHVLKVIGYPIAGNALEDTKNINVQNGDIYDNPLVDISSLQNNDTVTASTFQIAGNASDSEGLAKVEVFVDGQLEQTKNISGNQASFAFDAEVSADTASFQTYSAPAAENFTKITSFGTNPGNLNMYIDVPTNMPANRPVVMVLHGCQQTASGYRTDTEWNVLAEKYKFYVVHGEQTTENTTNKTGNPYKCFNWAGYYGEKFAKGEGENQSLKEMIDYMKSHYSVDNSKVFVTGLSAGGGMAAVMLAKWPEIFAAGAPMAGVYYNCAYDTSKANDAKPAFDCMGVSKTGFSPLSGCSSESGEACQPTTRHKSASAMGDYVRQAYAGYTGAYPRVLIWQGLKDQYVDDINAVEMVEQWTNVHGTDTVADNNGSKLKDVNTNHTYKEYWKDGQAVVAVVELPNMKHGIAIDPNGTGEDAGGAKSPAYAMGGPYAFDQGIYSSYYSAKWWGIIGPQDAKPELAITSPSEGAANLTTVTVQASLSDDQALSKVELLVDGVSKEVKTISGTSYNYSYIWATTAADTGKRQIQLIVTDSAGQSESKSVNVYVRTEPSVPVYVTKGTHTIKVVATDIYGKQGEKSITIQVGAPDPALAITTPAASATFTKGSPITVTGTSANVKSIQVQLLGASTGKEYSKSILASDLENWTTSLATDSVTWAGGYKIKVTAYDAADQAVLTKEVSITIN